MDPAQFAASAGVTLLLLLGVMLTFIGLPGNLLILLTAIGYAYLDNFAHIGGSMLWLLFAAFLLGEGAEFLAGAISAKRHKASGLVVFAAIAGALLGGLVGSLIFPVIGSLLGSIVLAFLFSYFAELSRTRDKSTARQVAKGVVTGMVIGTACKIAVAVGMVVGVIWHLPWLGK